MSRYKRGDVVRVDISYYNCETGLYEIKKRPFVVIDVIDESDNITIKGTGQTHKSAKYTGVTVQLNSEDGEEMGIDRDTFFYCNQIVTLQNNEIKRRIGNCPEHILKEITKLSGHQVEED